MSTNCRFVLDEDRSVIDTLNPMGPEGICGYGDPEDEKSLRECVLWQRLRDPIRKLIVNRGPKHKFRSGEEGQLPNIDETYDIWWGIFNVIRASHLNTFDPEMSIQYRSGGKLNRQKIGTQHFTSLALFCDDVELLLRDLYGDVDSETLDRVLRAALIIVNGITRHVRKDLSIEHHEAVAFDRACGIGIPDGQSVNGSMWRHGMLAKSDLISRVCEVRPNPSAFSEYTVEFAKQFEQRWVCSLDTASEARGDVIE